MKLLKDLENKLELTYGDNTDIEEAVEKMKLIAEYKNFKRNNVQHFRFYSIKPEHL